MGKIRLWKMGSVEHKITPTKEAVVKLTQILAKAKESGEDILELIWDDAIDVKTVEGDDDVILVDEACIIYLRSKGYTVEEPDAK